MPGPRGGRPRDSTVRKCRRGWCSPTSWPTRSISTNPGTASFHSTHVGSGSIFSSDPGLVCGRPSGEQLGQVRREPAVQSGRRHRRHRRHRQQRQLGVVGDHQLLETSQPGHQLGHDRGQPLPRRNTQHRPAEPKRSNDFRAGDQAPGRPAAAPGLASGTSWHGYRAGLRRRAQCAHSSVSQRPPPRAHFR